MMNPTLQASPPQWLLAAFFIMAGTLHFVFPDSYVAVMPPSFPSPGLLVALSGACEIAGGLGVLWQPVRRAAGLGLVLLCIAVLPANWQMLVGAMAADKPQWQLAALVLRLPLQGVLVWWIWACCLASRRRRTVRPEPAFY